MSGNKDDTVRQFCDVTGADETRSRFFLESSNWQLEVALSSFYEHGGIDEGPVNPPPSHPNPVSVPVLSDSDMESPPGSPLKVQKKDKTPKRPGNQNFATLSSLQQESSSDEEEVSAQIPTHYQTLLIEEVHCNNPHCPRKCDHSEERDRKLETAMVERDKEIARLQADMERLLKENGELEGLRLQVQSLAAECKALREELEEYRSGTGQAFYAGGSDRSGQQIIGPGKKDIVTEMFKSMRERGAVGFEEEPSTARRGGSGPFGGVGYRLGQTPDDHEAVATGGAGAAQGGVAAPRSVRLRLYREGFTVDDGALRAYTDPQHAHFLNSIRRGEIPPELLTGGAEVRVSLEDRRHEETPPKQRGKSAAFTGKGQMLGSPTPATVGATAPVAADVGDPAANERAAQAALNLDEAQPITNIQFRLADGSRLTGRFNHTHTVGSLRQYVVTAVPAYQIQSFVLMTAFPSVELTETSKTLEEANLLNSVVIQRLK